MMRSVLALSCCVIVTTLDAAGAFRERDTQEFRHTLRFNGRGERQLVVRTIQGSIRVSAGRRQDAELRVRRTIEADTEADIRTAEREVVLETRDGQPTVEALVLDNARTCGDNEQSYNGRRRPRYSATFDFDIVVPEATSLVLCTVNGREVTVSGTRGDFDVSNINGHITLDRVAGGGRATTINGPIRATLLSRPDVDSVFKTLNGDVSVTWPADLDADLHLKTQNGGLYTDFDVETMAARRTASGQRRDGRFVLRSNEFTSVRVGRGGPDVTLETFNGDVRVLRASR
jgi:hypothetical protein